VRIWVIQVLKRVGFVERKKSPGSHLSLVKETPDRKLVVVPMAKREVPRGTFKSILQLAQLTEKEFLRNLR